ncbi:MAG: glycoside hydrolase family 92 protein [Bacteroidales bacterium]|nr:glycoside hydrolase family 92 protein [Bacteroidales bacterium]
MKKLLTIALAFLSLSASAQSLVSYVNPFIGTSNFGTTNPGAVCPGGMMSVTPFNVMGSQLNTWDKDSRWWSTPFSSDNCFFTGFSHVNLSGVGCPEVGVVLTMPTSGPLQTDYREYGSEYSELKAEPGWCGLRLDKGDIYAEVSATMRSSVERYTFHKGLSNILVNLGEGLTNEYGASLRKISDTEIEGMRFCGTFCYNPGAVFPLYFAIRVSRVPDEAGFWKRLPKMNGVEAEWTPDNGKQRLYKGYGRELAGDDIGYWFSFETQEGEQIVLQMGVSFVSCANAWENLNTEQSGLDFDRIRRKASDTWEADLSRVKVEGGSLEQKQVFYTGLYHALIHPNVLNDVNGEYPLMEQGGIGRVQEGHSRYTVYSLWDTYRNVHQLLTLLYPERQLDMVRSMVDIYKEWGWLPKWELFGRETFTMEGDPAIPVIADTWLKGLRDFDIETAYQACLKGAETPQAYNRMRPDGDLYREKGYIPMGGVQADLSGDNSVSHALEYYVADNALSLLAADLGHPEDAKLYRERSLGYRHYYDRETGVLRPIMADGSFLSPFDPKQGENFENAPGFHEGSAWNYTFYVPHDIEGLAKLMGGPRKFVDRLQSVFDKGNYDPANEPDIAYPFLFCRFPGYEWRSDEVVASLLAKHFSTQPYGIPGNDDTGAMSAWAVFSMMGFYPDCPGDPSYSLVRPTFDKVTITLDPKYCGGRESLTIIAPSGSGKIKGIKSSKGSLRRRISHRELIGAGTIRFY